MSKGNTFENDFLQLIFNAVPIANLADDAASGALTELWISLHTANPDEGGDQETNETTYGSYARVSVARAAGAGGWTISGNSVSPTDIITFPQCTLGTATITHAAIGTDETGPGKILYKGALTPNIEIAVGVTPRITDTSTITED
jgi:hypothetical protein